MKYLVLAIGFMVVSGAFASEEENDEFTAFLSNCSSVQSWADMPVDPYGRDDVAKVVELDDEFEGSDVEFLCPVTEILIPARPVKKFIPTYLYAMDPVCKKIVQNWYCELVDFCKYGEGVDKVQAILANCPELVYKLNHNKHSLLYLVVRHAKSDADEEKGEVFSGVSERLKIMGRIVSALQLLSNPLELSFNLSSILAMTCLHGHTDMALMLLDFGADINYVDEDGNSNFHHAVCNDGHAYEMLKMLIEKGIDVNRFLNAVNNYDNAPLNILYSRLNYSQDQCDANELLCRLGACVNLKKE